MNSKPPLTSLDPVGASKRPGARTGLCPGWSDVRLRWFAAALGLAPGWLWAVAPPRPNIVIILSDDLGYGSVGCYGADPKLVRTPNIDRLAREGRRFTDANTTSSVCSPTRYGLLTGRYCWRTSLAYGVLSTQAPLHLEAGRLTLASLLQHHGYATAAIGKWHLGYGDAKTTDFTRELRPGPLEVGFDYHFGLPSNHGDPSGVYVEDRGVAGLRSRRHVPAGRNLYGAPYIGLDAPYRVDEEVMPLLTRKCVAWLRARDPARPFFLYYAPVAVHNPITPSAVTKGTSPAGPYGDWIHELDRSVGVLLDALEQLPANRSTLVIFTSDNGGSGQMSEVKTARPPTPRRPGEAIVAMRAGLDLNKPWRGRKHSIYQGGFRVPFIVRWPGRVAAGSSCAEPISLVDLVSTVAAVLGATPPPAAQAAEDSYNFLPALLGEKYRSPLRPHLIFHNSEGIFAIREGPWKWIEGRAAKPGPPVANRADEYTPQLYNLQADPAETTNVLAQHPAVAERLAGLLEENRKRGRTR